MNCSTRARHQFIQSTPGVRYLVSRLKLISIMNKEKEKEKEREGDAYLRRDKILFDIIIKYDSDKNNSQGC